MSSKNCFLLGLAASFFACQNQQPPATKAEKIASAFCECTAQLAALNKETAALAADTIAGKDLRPQFLKLQEEYQRAKDCSATVISKFGKLQEEDFKAVEAALAGKCPDMAEQRDLLRELLGE